MVKVIRAFHERYHNMKRYKIGDSYPDEDTERIGYLVQEGYLENPAPSKKVNTDEPSNAGGDENMAS